MPRPNQKILPKALIGPIRMKGPPSAAGVPGIACIYRITCTPIQRHYIGQTTDAARRWLEHQTDLALDKHINSAMQLAYNHFGPAGFTFSILEHLPARYDEATFTLAEQRWLDAHGHLSRFNVRPAGNNHWLKNTVAGRSAAQAAQWSFKRNRDTFRG